jgi:hypothetical protein
VLAAASYVFGMLVALLCAVLLTRGYKQSRQRLLLWSSICFFGLALHSALIFLDMVVFPDIDLHLLRRGSLATAMVVLVFGLIWDSD